MVKENINELVIKKLSFLVNSILDMDKGNDNSNDYIINEDLIRLEEMLTYVKNGNQFTLSLAKETNAIYRKYKSKIFWN